MKVCYIILLFSFLLITNITSFPFVFVLKWLLLGDHVDQLLSKFSNLIHLELILPLFNLNYLMSWIQACHMLQVLIIQNDKVC